MELTVFEITEGDVVDERGGGGGVVSRGRDEIVFDSCRDNL